MSRIKKSLDHKRIRRLIWLVLTFFVLLGCALQSVAGSTHYSLMMQPSATVSSPPVVLEEGNVTGASTVYTNKTSAKVSVAAPAPVPTYFPSGYNVPSGNWWNLSYGYRKKITVVNDAESLLSSGYSVCLIENTTSLISAGKMLSSGNDLRILYWNATSSSWVELDRDAIDINTGSTKVWFKTQASIEACSLDTDYYMYYGCSSAGTPPANKNGVYSLWNDFDSLDGWTHRKGSDGGVLGTVSVSNSVLTLTPGDSYTDFVIHNSFTTSDSEGFSIKTRARARYGAQTEDDLLTAVFFASIDGNGNVNNDYNSRDKPSQSRFCKLINGVFSTIVSGTGNMGDTWYTYETFRETTDEMKLLRDGSHVCPTPASGWTSDSDLSSGYIGVGGEGANRNYDFDWILVRKYVDPEPSTYLGSEEQDYHVSGTVPGSVQNVDSDYLVIKSAGSSTSSPAYNPSNYALIDSTTWVSGGVSNLTSNDSVYMTFRSYENTSCTLQYYNSSEGGSSTTSGTYSDKVILTLTPSLAGNYLIIASAELRGTSAAYDVRVQMTIDGTTYAISSWEPDEANMWESFFTSKVINFDSSSHIIRIQYSSENTAQTVTIRRARIMALRLSNFESNEIESEQSVTSSTYTDIVTRTFTPSTQGVYLIVATAEVSAASTDYSLSTRLLIDGEAKEEMITEGDQTTDYEVFAAHNVTTLSAVSHTIKIQASRETTGTMYIRRARITAVRLGDYYDYQTSGSEEVSSTSSTSWQDKTVLAFTPDAAGDYLIMATAKINLATALNTYQPAINFTIDGNEYGYWQAGLSDSSDYLTFATMINVSLSAASHTLKIAYRTTSATYATSIRDARIVAVRLAKQYVSEVEFTGASNTYDWTQLDVSVDLSWTVGYVSVYIQVYDYQNSQYPPSGQAYSAYASSGNPNTDELRTLTMTSNPTYYRNSTGNWTIKIKGVKNTSTQSAQFDFKADWIEYKTTYHSEYSVSTEFLFSSMTKNTPTQLNFTVVSQYDITSVNVTIQVWNYNSSAYVTSGEGYLTYTSSGANETQLLSINTNPQNFTSAGNARINITGVLTTTTQYQQEINQVKLDYSYSSSSDYDHVLKVVNLNTDAWNISLKVYDNSNITRLSNATISFHDGTSSDQIIVSDGNITQAEGALYDLPAYTTIYIGIGNLQATTTDTSHLYVYLKTQVPNTSTYILFIIVFEIT